MIELKKISSLVLAHKCFNYVNASKLVLTNFA